MNTEPLRSVAAIDSADGADRRCRLVPAPVLHHRQPDNNLRQFVSPVCSSVMNFSIVTTSALFCDSMIVEIAQIGDVRKSPAEKYSRQGIRVFTALVR